MLTIKLFANLRRIAGQKELSIPGQTLKATLNDLVQQHPELDGVILENGKIHPHIIMTLNGQNIPDSNVAVIEADIIAIFPPIAGG